MNHKTEQPRVFGIRHLSPAGSYHLIRFLEEVKPEVILIEGLSDANDQIPNLTSAEIKPPVAILAYTQHLPIKTVLYPFADYSPEYQALLWGKQNNTPCRFIDLPAGIFLALEEIKDPHNENLEFIRTEIGIHETIARLAGEPDHESYWERYFEHNLTRDNYWKTAAAYSRNLREFTQHQEEIHLKHEYAINLVREAFMRKQIKDSGYDPGKTVVVTGAYHASALTVDLPVMTEEELKKLPGVDTRLTLMPYSYYKLSRQSGYGAGNNAPAYFEMMWQCMRKNELENLPCYYFAEVVSHLRQSGTFRSPAEVIEGVRLANALAALHSGAAPTLKDLEDAAVVALGQGDPVVAAEAMARVEVGTAIGFLPEGMSQTPIQDDFNREIKRLKLENYHTNVARDLDLDLRENRRVKSQEAAFIDLHRSFFLHRLTVLGVRFAQLKPITQEKATWSEKWVLHWTPEAEIELVESTLRGETVELAAAFEFKERLHKCEKIGEAARVIRLACECGMSESMQAATRVLQSLATDNGDFVEIAKAARELAVIITYGDLRKFSPEPLIPLMQQLFLRGSLLLLNASSCNKEAAEAMIPAINSLNLVALEQDEQVDGALWLEKLMELSHRDDKNPTLSGYATAILLERNKISDEKLSQEVSRRLSPGIEADIGAGWFEGLALKNRYALLSRLVLWEQLAAYVSSLEKEQFQRALVFLRRAFGTFTKEEKHRIAEILGEIWQIDTEYTTELLNKPLDENEQKKLESLEDYDFGDL